MKKVVVASKNPVKIKAAFDGFHKMFPEEVFEVQGTSVESGVDAQPKGDAEIFLGATSRAKNASAKHPRADFCVGIEGGVEEKDGDMEAYAWVVIQGKGSEAGKARTGTFMLPRAVADLINQGKELGEADDIVFGRTNSKQLNGAVGILTDNVIDRATYYTEAVIFALIPFKNHKLYN